MITGISYVYFIALVCALRLFSDCTATDALSSISQSSTAKAATAAAAAVAAAGQARATIVTAVSSTSDWEPRMIVNSVHSIGHNNLAHTEVLNSEPLRHSDSYPYYAGPNNYNYSDQDDKGLGHYSTATSRTTSATAEIAATAAAAPSAPNQSYLSQITDAYKNAATNSNKHNQNNNYINNNVLPISPNNIMSRINVRPLQNEVTANPTIFNSQYFNTFREIKSTVVTIFQRVQEFVSYMFNFFTTGKFCLSTDIKNNIIINFYSPKKNPFRN